MRPLYLYEIAHIIVRDRVGTVELLKGLGLEVSASMSDEAIFKVVLENKQDENAKVVIHKMYDRDPLNQFCTSCYETIRKLHDSGVVMSNELKSKSE